MCMTPGLHFLKYLDLGTARARFCFFSCARYGENQSSAKATAPSHCWLKHLTHIKLIDTTLLHEFHKAAGMTSSSGPDLLSDHVAQRACVTSQLYRICSSCHRLTVVSCEVSAALIVAAFSNHLLAPLSNWVNFISIYNQTMCLVALSRHLRAALVGARSASHTGSSTGHCSPFLHTVTHLLMDQISALHNVIVQIMEPLSTDSYFIGNTSPLHAVIMANNAQVGKVVRDGRRAIDLFKSSSRMVSHDDHGWAARVEQLFDEIDAPLPTEFPPRAENQYLLWRMESNDGGEMPVDVVLNVLHNKKKFEALRLVKGSQAFPDLCTEHYRGLHCDLRFGTLEIVLPHYLINRNAVTICWVSKHIAGEARSSRTRTRSRSRSRSRAATTDPSDQD